MDEGVVEGGVDVGNAEDELALADLGAERDGFLSSCLSLLGGLCVHPLVRLCIQRTATPSTPSQTAEQHLGVANGPRTISNDLREA